MALASTFKTASSINPDSASPTLKTPIDFQLSGFTEVLDASDFSVNVTLITLSKKVSPYYNFDINTRTKRINIISVNDTTKTITGMFGGAYSGTY